MAPGPTPRALIFGIDGGSLDLIAPLIDAGRLPVLAGLLRSCAHGPTTTTWPAHTAPGWATFVTGRRPGGHGVYQFFDTQEPGYRDRLVGTGDYGCGVVWEWLARQGLSTGIINVPMSHPPRDLPGYQITWPLAQTLRFSRPATLLGEMARAGAGFRPDITTMFQGDHAYFDLAVDNVRARGRSVEYLMREHPADVVMAVVTEVDRICHHYWHFCDHGHPRYEPPARDEWATAVAAVYEEVDAMLGDLLALVDDDTRVMVVSDHGFGPGRHHVAVNRVLAEAGLLATRPGAPNGEASWFHEDGRVVDWSRTRAYMPTPHSYAVNLNLAGRQDSGVVRPGDAGRVRDEVTELLGGLRAPDTGERIFAEILPREVAYPGPMTAAAPDLLLVPADQGVLASPNITGPVWRPSEQTGMHRYEGMWAYRSPALSPGRRDTPVALADLVPTLLHDLGLSHPAGIDGRPLPELYDAAPPVPFLPEDDDRPAAPDDEVRLLAEDDATARTLSAMGYL
ncbi:alkaline phosphatase family protein [Actinomadura viridis]|uniref:AlkP superfamily phosphohydrolase/phosphomutase n=1 Tax=Actinomadura viridis TaxID=58110 RepID=A0A931DE73_9ACTN|nr:alkaline phosphatase family protein [Actinomadura viridis]MBG6085936.1 putative AlkP superfamily phosphohydrolase/phosphomutase [Actinomadura viridis]